MKKTARCLQPLVAQDKWIEKMMLVALKSRRFNLADYRVQRAVENYVESPVFVVLRDIIIQDKWNEPQRKYDYSAGG